MQHRISTTSEAVAAQPVPRLGRLRNGFATSRGWRRRGILFLSGAICLFAFAPFFAWPLLFATFPVLLWTAEDAARSPRPARTLAHDWWWFAFGYFFTGLYWIGEAFLVEAEIFGWLLPFAITLLPAGLALFWAAAGVLTAQLWPDRLLQRPAGPELTTLLRCMTAAGAIGLAEWLRGHVLTGFPWNTPGIAITMPLPLMQSASVLGIYGLTTLAVFLLVFPVTFFSRTDSTFKRKLKICTLGVFIPFALLYGFGLYKLALPHSDKLNGVQIRIVQPSIPQRDKWIASRQPAIFSEHLELSQQNPSGRKDGLEGISHVIWPEAAMPFGPLDHPEALDAIGKMLPRGAVLLAGALRQESDPATGERKVYNSLIAFGDGGRPVATYDKIHLVPFGEYLPFQQALEAIGLQSLTRMRGGFASGVSPRQLMRVAGMPPLTPLICYETIFPDEVVPTTERTGLIVIVTNDGWFGNSVGPHQHFHQARVRAVEQGVTVIRAANNGISGAIDPEGRVLGLISLDERKTFDTKVPQMRSATLYSLWNNLLFWIMAIAFLTSAIVSNWIRSVSRFG